MDSALRKAEIVRLVRELAKASGGAPPGQEKFTGETGIKPHVWRGNLWRTWSDVLKEAGFAANVWTAALPEDWIFETVGELAHRIGRFPNSTDLKFERANNPSFPGQKTIVNRQRTMVELAEGVRKYAESSGDGDLVVHCNEYLATVSTKREQSLEPDPVTIGYVYMIRYGRNFKIGRTSSPNRRSRQIQIELPDATELVHAILTDDPVGIEAYWHRRFEGHRGNGEWFKLPATAIAAFKKWTKIA